MRKEWAILIVGILIASVFMSHEVGATTSLPVSLEKTLLNGKELSLSDNVRLVVDRGEDLKLDLELEVLPGSTNVEDLQVLAMITGYEHAETNPLVTSSDVFDIEKDENEVNVSYTRWETLHLQLPEDMKPGNYKLRIIISNKDAHTLVYEYNINIDYSGTKVSIVDIILSPSNYLQAGNYLIGKVRVRNDGEKTEENVKVVLEIPELGVEGVDYIDELDGLESASSEEVALKIPVCTKEGEYEVRATVYYDDLYQSSTATKKIKIIPSDACELTQKPYETPEKTILSLPTQELQAKTGEKEYLPITIVNTGKTATTVSFEVEGNDWGEVEFKPSNIVIVKGEESKVVTLYIKPKDNMEGNKMLVLDVKKNGKLAKQIPIKVNIEKKKEETSRGETDLKTVLEVAIVVLVIILVIIGLVLAFKRMKGSSDEEETQTYY